MTACLKCNGSGFEIVSKDGYEYARLCVCRRPAPGADEDDLLRRSRIPPRYEHCSFGNFDPGQNVILTKALTKVMEFCNGYPYRGVDEGLGVLFLCDNGVGKTHLAVGALRELVVTKGIHGEFWDFHDLIRQIRSSYNPETKSTEEQLLAPIVEMDLLVLDDLGAWKMTDWMLDTLFYILNSRYMSQRSTIITSNFNDASPQEVARDESLRRKEYLVERVGNRLRSRLHEMCMVVRIVGCQDRREQKQHSYQTPNLRYQPWSPRSSGTPETE